MAVHGQETSIIEKITVGLDLDLQAYPPPGLSVDGLDALRERIGDCIAKELNIPRTAVCTVQHYWKGVTENGSTLESKAKVRNFTQR